MKFLLTRVVNTFFYSGLVLYIILFFTAYALSKLDVIYFKVFQRFQRFHCGVFEYSILWSVSTQSIAYIL
jgi:hypothetical protein